jgi:hypothetical protein
MDDFRSRALHLAAVCRLSELDAAGDAYPEMTLKRLQEEALAQYVGIAVLLDEPLAVTGADVLLRSLIECAAQIAWVTDSAGSEQARGYSARRRALCFELGSVKQFWEPTERSLDEIVTRMQPYIAESIASDPEMARVPGMQRLAPGAFEPEYDAAVAELRSDIGRIETLHAAEGCDCRGHGYQIQSALREMAEGDPLVHIFWKLTSGVAHHLHSGMAAQHVNGPTAAIDDLNRVRGLHFAYASALLLRWSARSFTIVGVPVDRLRIIADEISVEMLRMLGYGRNVQP